MKLFGKKIRLKKREVFHWLWAIMSLFVVLSMIFGTLGYAFLK